MQPTRSLLTVAGLALLAVPTVAQAPPTYVASVPGKTTTSNGPVLSYYHTDGNSYNKSAVTALARTGRTRLYGFSSVGPKPCCYAQETVRSNEDVTWNDLVISSPNPTETFYVNLGITGDYSGNHLTGADITVDGPPTFQSAGWSYHASSGTHTSHGGLTGYTGKGPFDFKMGPFTVGTNSPFSLRFGFSVLSEAYGPGNLASNAQTLVFGSATGADLPLFEVGPGVSVDSAQAGVIGNTQTPDTNTYLATNTPTVNEGDTADLVTWNGAANSPAILFLTGVNGVFVIDQVAVGMLDASGYWRHELVAPPGSSGTAADFHSVTLRNGKLDIAGPVTITVQ